MGWSLIWPWMSRCRECQTPNANSQICKICSKSVKLTANFISKSLVPSGQQDSQISQETIVDFKWTCKEQKNIIKSSHSLQSLCNTFMGSYFLMMMIKLTLRCARLRQYKTCPLPLVHRATNFKFVFFGFAGLFPIDIFPPFESAN